MILASWSTAVIIIVFIVTIIVVTDFVIIIVIVIITVVIDIVIINVIITVVIDNVIIISELECCSCPSSNPCAGRCTAIQDLPVVVINVIAIVGIFLLYTLGTHPSPQNDKTL